MVRITRHTYYWNVCNSYLHGGESHFLTATNLKTQHFYLDFSLECELWLLSGYLYPDSNGSYFKVVYSAWLTSRVTSYAWRYWTLIKWTERPNAIHENIRDSGVEMNAAESFWFKECTIYVALTVRRAQYVNPV